MEASRVIRAVIQWATKNPPSTVTTTVSGDSWPDLLQHTADELASCACKPSPGATLTISLLPLREDQPRPRSLFEGPGSGLSNTG